MYPDIGTVDFNLFKLKSYYDICNRKNDDFVRDKPFELRSNIEKENTSKNHILLIDQTRSTPLDSTNFGNFKKNLIEQVKKDTFIKDKDILKLNVKDLLYYTLINSLRNNYDTLLVIYYKNVDSIFTDIFTKKQVHSIYDFKPSTVSDIHQKTNFKIIFDTIPNLIKQNKLTNYSITFFSDFYHDDTIKASSNINTIKIKKINGSVIKDFQDSVKNAKLNLIVLWQENYKDKQRKDKQEELLKTIEQYYNGIGKIDYLYTNNYIDDKYWTKRTSFEEFDELLTSMNENDTIISLYASTINSLKYSDAVRKIKMDNNRSFKWKIKSIDPTKLDEEFIKYNRNCEGEVYGSKNNRRYFINQWYEEECYSLYLSVKLKQKKDNYIDDLRFVYYYTTGKGVDKKNYFGECKIVIKEILFEDNHQNNLRLILNSFCVLFIICIVCGEILIIIYLYNIYEQRRTI